MVSGLKCSRIWALGLCIGRGTELAQLTPIWDKRAADFDVFTETPRCRGEDNTLEI